MKKQILSILFIGIFTISSCSNDDDGDNFEGNIVATWNLTAVEPPLLDISECPTEPIITFNDDETTNWTIYDADNNCETETDSGTWEQNSKSNYTITVPGLDTPIVGNVDFQNENEFTFKSTYQTIEVVLYFEK